MNEEIVIRIAPDGRTAECLYTEAIDLTRLGAITDIRRASDVRWSGVFRGWIIEERESPMLHDNGAVAVFPTRSAAIAHEIRVLNHRLAHRDPARRALLCTTCRSQTQTR